MNLFSTKMLTLAANYFDDKDLLKLTDTSFLGKLVFGLKVTAIGVGIVFGILVIIWAILALFGYVFKNLNKTSENTLPESVAEEIMIEPGYKTAEIAEEPNDEEIIAVISAAIAAQMGKSVSDFKVVSFKKRTNWNIQ